MNTLWYNRDMEPVLMHLHHYSLKTRANPIYLKQCDFDNGTYRITTSGYYVLSEDIVKKKGAYLKLRGCFCLIWIILIY